MEAQKILDCKVACIGEVHNTAKNQPKILIFGARRGKTVKKVARRGKTVARSGENECTYGGGVH